MSNQSTWPTGYQQPTQSNPYLSPDSYPNPAIPSPLATQPNDWGSLSTDKSHGASQLWMMGAKISAGIVAVFSIVFGIVMYSNIERWTANLNSAFFLGGQPNTGLAISVMIGMWVMGFVAAFLIMMATDIAADIRNIRTSTEHRR